MPRVEIHTVEVEEGGVDEEEHVDVAGQQERDDEQGRGSEKLEGKCVHVIILLAQLGECFNFWCRILSGHIRPTWSTHSSAMTENGEGLWKTWWCLCCCQKLKLTWPRR